MSALRQGVAAVIRGRKLRTREAWAVLGDRYLENAQKWTQHIDDFEEEEFLASEKAKAALLDKKTSGSAGSTDDSKAAAPSASASASASSSASSSAPASTGRPVRGPAYTPMGNYSLSGLGAAAGFIASAAAANAAAAAAAVADKEKQAQDGGGSNGSVAGGGRGARNASALATSNRDKDKDGGGGRGVAPSSSIGVDGTDGVGIKSSLSTVTLGDPLKGDQDQAALVAIVAYAQSLAKRVEAGGAAAVDMFSPWVGPDLTKAPAPPAWPSGLRDFIMRKQREDEEGEKARCKEEEEEEEEEDEEGHDLGGEPVSSSFSSSSSSSSSSSLGSAPASAPAPGVRPMPGQVAIRVTGQQVGPGLSLPHPKLTLTLLPKPSAASASASAGREDTKAGGGDKRDGLISDVFPSYARGVSDVLDLGGSRLTTDGRRQMCGALLLNQPCPAGCNCARQVDNSSRFESPWSDLDKAIFVDKFVQYPKNFAKIASYLKNQSTRSCIKFYYDSKTVINYKALLREADSRRRGALGHTRSVPQQLPWAQALTAAAVVGSYLYPPSLPDSPDPLTEMPVDDFTFHSFHCHPPFAALALGVIGNEHGISQSRFDKLRPIPRATTIHRALRNEHQADVEDEVLCRKRGIDFVPAPLPTSNVLMREIITLAGQPQSMPPPFVVRRCPNPFLVNFYSARAQLSGNRGGRLQGSGAFAGNAGLRSDRHNRGGRNRGALQSSRGKGSKGRNSRGRGGKDGGSSKDGGKDKKKSRADKEGEGGRDRKRAKTDKSSAATVKEEEAEAEGEGEDPAEDHEGEASAVAKADTGDGEGEGEGEEEEEEEEEDEDDEEEEQEEADGDNDQGQSAGEGAAMEEEEEEEEEEGEEEEEEEDEG